MRKLLATFAIVIAVAMPMREAKAQVVPAIAATAALPAASVAFWTGFAAFALLPVAIVELQDVKPWSKVFPSVDENFPRQKHYQGDDGYPWSVPTSTPTVNHKPYHIKVNGVDTIRMDG